MKKNKWFIATVTLLSATGFAQSNDLQKLEIIGQPVSIDNAKQQSIVKTATAVEQQNVVVLSESSEMWNTAEGSWFYKSEFTGKTYPTTVKYGPQVFDGYGNATSDIIFTLENELFGRVLFALDTITGYKGSGYDYDENGNPNLPKLNEAHEGGQRTIFIGDFLTDAHSLLSRSFPLSGKARLLANYPLLDDYLNNNQINSTKICNDWLYNTEAIDCTISAEYSLVYYNGEKNAKVKLNCGEGVTDVYYIIGNDTFDKKRSQADEDTDLGYRHPITSDLVPEYIAEYKAGILNEAYTIGQVNPSANEFDIPLPNINGIRKLLIVAYSGNNITDMKDDYIEIRRPEEWNYYGSVKLESYFPGHMMYNGKDEYTPSILKETSLPIEINNDSTMLRIVNPFICEINEESNYIYINISMGLDKAYIDGSFTPNEDIYYYSEINGEQTTIKKRYFVCDILSANIIRGYNQETLLENNYLTTDLSDGFVTISNLLARCYNIVIYPSNSLYINNSYSGQLKLTLDNAVKSENDYKGVTFKVGDNVSYLLYDFGYVSSNTRNKVVKADNISMRVDVIDGQATLNLNEMYHNNIISAIPVSLNYTAYTADDKPLRSGSVDISGIDFSSKYCMGNVRFHTSTDGFFTDKELYINRIDDDRSDRSTVKLKEFSSTLDYFHNEPEDLSLSFDNSGNCIQENQIYITNLKASGYSNNLATYAELENLKHNNGTIVGDIYYRAYDSVDNSPVGYFTNAFIEITLPDELTYDYSGVEDIAIDNEDNAEPIFYNLQGIRMQSPVKGNIVIEVKGNKVRKVIL